MTLPDSQVNLHADIVSISSEKNENLDLEEEEEICCKESADENSNKNETEPELDDEAIQNNCWSRFRRTLRAIWATRFTEDTAENRDLYVSTTLRELLIYILFLCFLSVVTFCMTNISQYWHKKVLTELLTKTTLGPESRDRSFSTAVTIQDFWLFMKRPLLDSLYTYKRYNNMNVSKEEQNSIVYENKLLGVPRVRQLRVRSDSCDIASDFEDKIKNCYAMYSEDVEDKKSFGLNNGTAWTYNTKPSIDTINTEGNVASYGGGGFYVDLSLNRDITKVIIDSLFKNLWVDRATRAVLVDFTVYNANLNLFCVVKLVFEFPSTGGMMTRSEFRSVKLIRYVSPKDYFVLVCECIFMMFVIYYIVEEVIEIRKHKISYFTNFWSWLDLIVIITSVVCAAFNVYRTMAVSNKLESLLGDAAQFPDFDWLSYWQLQFNHGIAFTVFIAWIKIFKYISFNKTMTQLSQTLGSCAKDLAGFAVMFFIVFFAFAQLGYLIFGTQVNGFREFSQAVYTLFRIILGDFDFQSLESAHRILGPMFFLCYVFFVFFVLINMFLAIINDTYSGVKNEMRNQENEFNVGDFLKQKSEGVLTRLQLKSDKIVDIQKAIKMADMNKDEELDYNAWRKELKHCGYADAEICAIFSKYDNDGDKALSSEEQRKMQRDLEGQKAAINEEIQDREEDLEEQLNVNPESLNRQYVTQEQFGILNRRLNNMEYTADNIFKKLDTMFSSVTNMEKNKKKKRQKMLDYLDEINQNVCLDAKQKCEKMCSMIRDEIMKLGTETDP